ncbi:MAG: hypothetical protein IPG85_18295 [Bacteroidetes bacterium]|nr:hypothetical protein [Bacteroidota bacterium]
MQNADNIYRKCFSCTAVPIAAVDRNNFCADDLGNISLSASGGAGTTLQWFTGSCGGTSIGTGNPLVIASPTVTTTYYVRYADACGNLSCRLPTLPLILLLYVQEHLYP